MPPLESFVKFAFVDSEYTMLTESFLVSVAAPEKGGKNTLYKDIGIHQYQFHPVISVESTYKKSSTPPNCLAVTTSHIFAAQTEKAVIHVYNKNNASQEAVVPFRERIHSIAICGDATGGGVLVLGTQGGGVILWEVGLLDHAPTLPRC